MISYPKYKKRVKFEIWDTLGQEKFRSMNRIFYKDVNAAILVFDITRKESFEQIKLFWFNEIKEKITGNNITAVLCGNKSDLTQYQEIEESEVREYAVEKKVEYKETSSKNGSGIDVCI